MKKLEFLLIFVSCFFFQDLQAQNCCHTPTRKKDTSYVLPKLIDTNLFISDIEKKLDLKSVFDELKRDTLSGIYMYTFDINERGELEPRLYYNKKSVEMKKIQQFVETDFNNFRWIAGYKKKCNTCKVKVYLQLIFYLNTDTYTNIHPDVNDVVIDIEDIETVSEIFHLVIPYKDLKSFN